MFSGTEKSWSPLERVLVTETNDSLFCPCVGSKHSCVHKGIIRWANGTSPLEKSKSSPQENPNALNDKDEQDHLVGSVVADWHVYLASEKIDPEYQVDFSETAEFENLAPDEVHCPWCGKEMVAQLVTDKAVIVDQHFVKRGKDK